LHDAFSFDPQTLVLLVAMHAGERRLAVSCP
jgi:hypothetical protein